MSGYAKGAVPPGRDRAPALRGEPESTHEGRMVVPQLSELAGMIPAHKLATLKTEVEAGERVAIYVRTVEGTIKREVRVVIVGPGRAMRYARAHVDRWHLIAEVEITPEGERALPARRIV